MTIKKSVLDTIGKTPLIQIDRFKKACEVNNKIQNICQSRIL